MSAYESVYTRFEQALHGLVGQLCWSAAHSSQDDFVTLYFGAQWPRSIPLTASTLPIPLRESVGEYTLMLYECAWRVEVPDEVLASWKDDSSPGGSLMEALGLLVGQRVTAWDATWPGLDLALHFENNATLRLFCDQAEADEGDNYAFLGPHEAFAVGPRSRLTSMPRPRE